MKIRQRMVSFFVISLLALSVVSLGPIRLDTVKAQPNASLIGVISDKGVDTNGNGLYDYLNVTVGVNVYEPGYFTVEAYWLENAQNSSLYIDAYTSGYLNVGSAQLNLSFYGPTINHARFNPDGVGDLILMGNSTYDGIYYASLSRTYNYNEFDPHAYLTGRVYDKGVDTDHDGLFDYLETSIEVNVTEAGTYLVSVNGLGENGLSQIPDYQYSGPFDLNIGVHLFNITFYGPEIAYYDVNPIDVIYIYLEEVPSLWSYNGQTLDSIVSAPLITPYNFSQFDHPSNDMQVNFTVYPNGHVGINAIDNYTHMYPENIQGPVVNASARLSKANNLILGSVNGTVGLPPNVTVPWPYPYSQAQFPTNQTTTDYLSQYSNGILTEKLNATSLFPSIVKTQYPINNTDFTLYGTYSNGVMHAQLSGSSTIPQDVASEFPFNATDVTVKANLGSNNEFKGNITFRLVSGLPEMDLKVSFKGNRSAMQFTGNFSIIYGTYNGVVVNATTVSQLISEINSTIPGTGSGSLYNMTYGTLECTNIKITNATITGGVRIDYDASIQGDFAATIAKYINKAYFSYNSADRYYPAIYAALNATLSSVDSVSVVLAYTRADKKVQMDILFDSNVRTLWSNALKLIPPTVPLNETNELNVLLKLGNATAYAVQNAWLNVTYLGTPPQPSLALSMGLVENAARLKNDTVKLIPDLYSLYSDLYNLQGQNITQVQNIMKSYLNETYATLHSYNTTINLKNGIATFRIGFSFEGDLDKQLNSAKSYYLKLLNYEYSLAKTTLPTQMSLFNQTSIDINGLGVDFRYGRDNAFLNVTGVVVSPPTQVIDSFRFRLSNLLNATSENNEPPTRYQKLKIIIQGGNNSTYTIIPSRPNTVLAPSNVSLDGRTFTWENTTISSLKDMIFNNAYQGSYQNASKTYSVPILSNSTINSFNFDMSHKTISFTVAGSLGTKGFFNITIPRILLDINASTDTWKIYEDGTQVMAYNVTHNADYTFIYLVYAHSTHNISIEGTISNIPIVPEMQPNTMPFIILIVSLIAMLLIATQRKRIRSLKTKSLKMAYRTANSLSRLLKK